VFLYSGFVCFLLSFKVKVVGSGPTCQLLFVFASLTLRGALQAQRKLRCATAKKVTKNAATLRRSLTTTGASRSVVCPAVSEGLSPSGIGGTFFVLHLHQALRPSLPFCEIVVRLFITLCLALILSPSTPHFTQQLS